MCGPLLIAEDNEDDIILLKLALAKSAFDRPTHFVRNGEEAMEWLLKVGRGPDQSKAIFPAVLITDLKMPKMDGFELLKWVRSQVRFSKIPVIVYSSSGMRTDITRAYGLGATNYFQKTATFSDVIRCIETLPTTPPN